jgi:hypothetical protein
MERVQVLYADFTAIVENHMSFVSLLDTARGKGPTGMGVPPLVRQSNSSFCCSWLDGTCTMIA